MTRRSSRTVRSLHILFVTVALFLASTLAASADVLIPNRSTGGGGGGGSAVMLDEMARSQDLIALSEGDMAAMHPNTRRTALLEGRTPVALAGAPSLAINGRGQVAYEETEHALAQNAVAVAELEATTHPNAKSIARAEDVLAVGGVLAGRDELAQAPQADNPQMSAF